MQLLNDAEATMTALFRGPKRPSVPYAAEAVFTAGATEVDSRIFFGRDRARVETTVAGEVVTTIIRHDRRVIWYLLPDGESYVEISVTGWSEESPEVFRPTGSEAVNGVEAIRHDVTARDGEESGSRSAWFTPHNIMVRFEAEGSGYEVRELRLGSQSEELFELPAGLERVELS